MTTCDTQVCSYIDHTECARREPYESKVGEDAVRHAEDPRGRRRRDDGGGLVADLHFCKCTGVESWPEGLPVCPKWSLKSTRWYLSCPRWSSTNKEEGTSCSYFEWVSAKNVSKLGLTRDEEA